MNCLQKELQETTHFLSIYIEEAHAQDEWPLGKRECHNQPKALEERINLAKLYITKYHSEIPILVDDMDNNFEKSYASWPDRYYVIEGGEIMLIGKPTIEWGYDRESFATEMRALHQYRLRLQTSTIL